MSINVQVDRKFSALKIKIIHALMSNNPQNFNTVHFYTRIFGKLKSKTGYTRLKCIRCFLIRHTHLIQRVICHFPRIEASKWNEKDGICEETKTSDKLIKALCYLLFTLMKSSSSSYQSCKIHSKYLHGQRQ